MLFRAGPLSVEVIAGKRAEPVRVGIAGLGEIGREHARVLAASPWAELAGCADLSEAARAATPLGVPAFAELAELAAVADLEAVIVATPERMHRAPVEDALVAGHILRFEPRYAALRERVAAVDLGEPLHLTARRSGDLPPAQRPDEARSALAAVIALQESLDRGRPVEI